MTNPKNPAEFCDFIFAEAHKREILTLKDLADTFKISTKTICEIKAKKLPDFSKATHRRIKGWVRIVAQICNAFAFDLDACLQALGLPRVDVDIARANLRFRGGWEIEELTINDLEALTKLAQDLQQSLPLEFAFEYLSLRNKQQNKP